MKPIVEIRNVHKVYARGSEKLNVLQGVTVHVAPGEFLALKGPSGSGKTTLLNLMAGIDTPTSGKVTVNGRDISKMGEDQRNSLCSRWLRRIRPNPLAMSTIRSHQACRQRSLSLHRNLKLGIHILKPKANAKTLCQQKWHMAKNQTPETIPRW
jgi:ABC-type dipeptide/oligopeptide/nickel transport system ATPase subunit